MEKILPLEKEYLTHIREESGTSKIRQSNKNRMLMQYHKGKKQYRTITDKLAGCERRCLFKGRKRKRIVYKPHEDET